VLWTATSCLIAVAGFVAVPELAFRLRRRRGRLEARGLLWIAAALFVVAWWLPNPPFVHQTQTFTRHAVGGGAACAALALFVAINLGIRPALARIGLAYALTATLGSLIEIGELLSDERFGTGLTRDSAWDLLANAVGALTAAVLFELVLRARRATTG
jgi:hypothetical protein